MWRESPVLVAFAGLWTFGIMWVVGLFPTLTESEVLFSTNRLPDRGTIVIRCRDGQQGKRDVSLDQISDVFDFSFRVGVAVVEPDTARASPTDTLRLGLTQTLTEALTKDAVLDLKPFHGDPAIATSDAPSGAIVRGAGANAAVKEKGVYALCTVVRNGTDKSAPYAVQVTDLTQQREWRYPLPGDVLAAEKEIRFLVQSWGKSGFAFQRDPK